MEENKNMSFAERVDRIERIRNKLNRFHLTQRWLVVRMRDKGLITNPSEMSLVLSGKRTGHKVNDMLVLSDEILMTYENFLRNE